MRIRTLAAVAAASVLLVGLGSAAEADIASLLAPGEPPVVVAHRSADLAGAPENSLAWIAEGIARGVDIVHVNPQLTADGRYVLMHDATLNRTTDIERVFPDGPPDGPTRAQRGGRDYVRDYTLDEIGQLRLTGARPGDDPLVPSLEDALTLAEGRIVLMLGLKSYEVESLAAALAGHDPGGLLLHELYAPGTDQSKLRDLTVATGISAMVNLYGSRDYLADLDGIARQLGPGLRVVGVKSRGITPSFVARAEELGVSVFVSGWDGPEDLAILERTDAAPWQAAFEAGFGGLTDRPDEVLGILGR